jgi:GNAT superfamily N-acetyltransferase
MIPRTERLFEALDATWPAAARSASGHFTLRAGAGGGKRVSAASLTAALPANPLPDIGMAEDAMRALGQSPLYLLRGDGPLDSALADRGYARVDDTLLYVAPTADLAQPPQPVSLLHCWPPLGMQRALWAEGDTGPERIAVMARACDPKTAFIARFRNRAAGVGFAAVDREIAMLHALHVEPGFRRQGVARFMVTGIAHWARAQGADWLALAVTARNTPARALYSSLGMLEAGGYHYRSLAP